MLIHNARDLGLRMRDQRLELGLSQAALAKHVGVSRSWVIQVERGNPGAEIGLVLRALSALGLEVDVRGPEAAAPIDAGDTIDLRDILNRARGTQP
jgi:HTH-type transcriptional regulator/antitoxin HipB